MLIKFELNGNKVSVESAPFKKLVHILRIDFGLTGTKFGCGSGQCGSCMAFMNGEIINTCLIPAFRIQAARITTIEGFAGSREYTQIETAFATCGVSLCGFCSPGIIMATEALLHNSSSPAEQEIKEALAGNSCRCIGYTSLISGIREAARLRRKSNYARKR